MPGPQEQWRRCPAAKYELQTILSQTAAFVVPCVCLSNLVGWCPNALYTPDASDDGAQGKGQSLYMAGSLGSCMGACSEESRLLPGLNMAEELGLEVGCASGLQVAWLMPSHCQC